MLVNGIDQRMKQITRLCNIPLHVRMNMVFDKENPYFVYLIYNLTGLKAALM